MELHTKGRKLVVFNGHDFPGAIGGGRPCRDFEFLRQRAGFYYQAVITGRYHRVGKPGKNGLSIVMDSVGLAVHQFLGANDRATSCLADRLMSKANTEKRDFAVEPAHAINRDSRLVGCAGSRRDNDMGWSQSFNLINGNLVIAMNLYL